MAQCNTSLNKTTFGSLGVLNFTYPTSLLVMWPAPTSLKMALNEYASLLILWPASLRMTPRSILCSVSLWFRDLVRQISLRMVHVMKKRWYSELCNVLNDSSLLLQILFYLFVLLSVLGFLLSAGSFWQHYCTVSITCTWILKLYKSTVIIIVTTVQMKTLWCCVWGFM